MILPISPSGHNTESFTSESTNNIGSGFIKRSLTDILSPECNNNNFLSEETTSPLPSYDACSTREVCSDSSYRGKSAYISSTNIEIHIISYIKYDTMIPLHINSVIHLLCIGRRLVVTERVQKKSSESLPLPVDPIPFDYSQHHARYRRQARSTYCESPDSVRHVLFMLDTSGSIGSENFTSMTNAVSKLVHYFCHKIKVAMMVFNHDHFLEFCFDCFDNNCDGRRIVRDKIRTIRYRGGATFTGSATQCACETILTPDCGFDVCQACLDVVYITDGKSNDPHYDICDTVECLHNQSNADVNVYVFAIGDNINEDELNCIAGNSSNNYNHKGNNTRNHHGNAIFRVANFQSFSGAIHRLPSTFTSPAYQEIFSGQFDCFSSNPSHATGLAHDQCTLEQP